MRTNLHIDHKLLKNAVKAGGHKTQREAVDAALRLYVERRKQGLSKELSLSDAKVLWEPPKPKRRKPKPLKR